MNSRNIFMHFSDNANLFKKLFFYYKARTWRIRKLQKADMGPT